MKQVAEVILSFKDGTMLRMQKRTFLSRLMHLLSKAFDETSMQEVETKKDYKKKPKEAIKPL